MLPTNVLYYGQEEPLPERVTLRAGPLSLLYVAGDLRTIKLGDREVLRRVYVALRDRNWGTVPAVLSNVRVKSGDDSFRITYDAEHRQGEIDFNWQATIEGDAQGAVAFVLEGVARSTFLRNRIGFCVLHPMCECAGSPCRVEHTDGSIEESSFPEFISPHQPFMDIRAISHPVHPGLWAEVRFGGDVFEMEDQRNWTDASFKTYSTPLALPFPVEVRKGTRIAQSVTLSLRREWGPQREQGSQRASSSRREPCSRWGAAVPVETSSSPVTLKVGREASGTLPRIGLGLASHGQPLNERELAALRRLNLAHLRVDLHLAHPASSRAGWRDVLARAAREARALGVQLEVALHLSADAASELAALRAELARTAPPVCAWLVFDARTRCTPAHLAELARQVLSDYDPAAGIGGGTDAYFTDLNRQRPPVEALDRVCYSLNPQVHAFDNLSLVETLETQAVIVSSARRFVGDLPLSVTPVTLKPRFNPSVTQAQRAPGAEPEPEPGALPAQVDLRQTSLLGAGWTAGSVKYLAEGGIQSVTYYETSGWRGVMETAQGAPLPGRFRSLPGAVYPLYHVLADVGEFAGAEILPVVARRNSCARDSSSAHDSLRVIGLALQVGDRERVILANLTAEPQDVTLCNAPAGVRVRALDEKGAVDAMRSPVRFRAWVGEWPEDAGNIWSGSLLPYAILTLTGRTRSAKQEEVSI